MKYTKRSNSGFSLIELVIVITIVAVISYTIAAFILSATRTWLFIKSRETALSQGRVTMERIVREIRRERNPLLITIKLSNECEFVDIEDTANTINIKQSGTDLLYSVNDGTGAVVSTLTSGLVNPGGLIFTYLDSNEATAAQSRDIRLVKVKLSLFLGTQGVTLEDGVRLRNLL